MSDVLLLAWSNPPIPIPMFKAGLRYEMHAHEKCQKRNACHTQGWYLSILACVAFFAIFHVRALLTLIFDLRCKPCKYCVWQLLCRTTTVGGRGRVCWSVRRRLSVWTSVGRSAQVLGIVTHRIPAVLCSSQYQMRVSSETARHRRSLCRRSCQQSPFPVRCHETVHSISLS